MAGIPTTNILQPGIIAVPGGANRALVNYLQLLTPQNYSKYVERYGNENLGSWLMTYAGQEEVKNRDYFWFESRGKNLQSVITTGALTTTAGSTISGTITADTTYDGYSPLRVGETFRVASTNTEYEILTVPTIVTFTARPKIAITETIASGEILLLAGMMDVGEASVTREPQVHLDIKQTATVTEMRETWSATDLAEMTEVYYKSGVTGDSPAGGAQAGTSYFTYKGLVKATMRYEQLVDEKLMRGNVVSNTGLNSNGTSVGTLGFLPNVIANGQTVGYTPGILDIQKLHEITRVCDVNGCPNEMLWLMDIFQRTNFTDGIFKEFPAGAWVWGKNENSEEAAMNYGIESMKIDGYLLKAKKYKNFNTEVRSGMTPTIDYFRDFGVLCPMNGRVTNSRGDDMKHLTLMYQQPVAGGTIGNGIRVWQWGGGSRNPSDGTMRDHIEMICYKGLSVKSSNQFVVVKAQ